VRRVEVLEKIVNGFDGEFGGVLTSLRATHAIGDHVEADGRRD
jgi:hypothetical protein